MSDIWRVMRLPRLELGCLQTDSCLKSLDYRHFEFVYLSCIFSIMRNGAGNSRIYEWFIVSLILLLLLGVGACFYLYSRDRKASIEFQSTVYEELARSRDYYREILEGILELGGLGVGFPDSAGLSRIENKVELGERRLRGLLNQLDARMSDLEALARNWEVGGPNLAGEYADLGRLSSESGYHTEATGFYRESLQYERTEETLMAYARSMYLAEIRDDQEILRVLNAILVRSPYNREALTLRGRLHLEGGRGDLALESYEVLSELVPESIRIQRDTARLAFSEGRYEEALVYYERALVLEDEDASLHYELSEVWKILGDFAKAEAFLRKALGLDSTFAPPAFSLAEILFAGGRYEEAEEFAELYIQSRGKDYKGHLLLGDIKYKKGEFLPAESSWKRAQDVLVLNTEADISLWVDASLRIAQLFWESGKAEKALEYSLYGLKYEERAELLDIAIWSTERLGDEDASSEYRRRREKLRGGL